MSDTWYRDPPDLPPFEDGFGKLWTFDGRCLNPDPPTAAPDQITTREDLTAYIDQELPRRFAEILVSMPPPPLEPLTWADVEAVMATLPRSYYP